jgi:hypothetical protein
VAGFVLDGAIRDSQALFDRNLAVRRGSGPSAAQAIDHPPVATLAGDPPAALPFEDARLKWTPVEETSDDRQPDWI